MKDMEKMNVEIINREQLNELLFERINFAFDSLYFRYAIAIEELSFHKERQALEEGKRNFSREDWKNTQCMRFYNILEQILKAHEKDCSSNKK